MDMITPPSLRQGVERIVQRRVRRTSHSSLDRPLPHRRVTDSGTHGCDDGSDFLKLRSLDYKNHSHLPYPDNAAPSCNEIYDCDLVSSKPSRKYRDAGDSSDAGSEHEAQTINMTPTEAKKLCYLFGLKEGTPLDTAEKVKEMFCFDNDKILEVVQSEIRGEVSRFVKVDGMDKSAIENHIPWVQELDEYEAEFIRV